MAGAVWIGRGEGPESVESRLEVTAELKRIEALVEGLEVVAFRGRQHPRGAQVLIGGLGTVKAAGDAGAGPLFGHELFHGREDVHVEASQGGDTGELGIGGP